MPFFLWLHRSSFTACKRVHVRNQINLMLRIFVCAFQTLNLQGAAFIRGRRLLIFWLSGAAFIRGWRLFEEIRYRHSFIGSSFMAFCQVSFVAQFFFKSQRASFEACSRYKGYFYAKGKENWFENSRSSNR